MSATVIRDEFERALKTMVARAQMYEHGTEHMETIFGWALRAEFYHASNHVSVQEFFIKSVASHKAVAQILDLLHSFVSEFEFSLSLHEPSLPDRMFSHLSDSVGLLMPGGDTCVLPDHVTELFVNPEDVRDVFSDNRWFYSLALIRYLGGTMITEDAPPISRR